MLLSIVVYTTFQFIRIHIVNPKPDKPISNYLFLGTSSNYLSPSSLLREMSNIKWDEKIRNKAVGERTGVTKLSVATKRRRFQRKGYFCRMGEYTAAKRACRKAQTVRRNPKKEDRI